MINYYSTFAKDLASTDLSSPVWVEHFKRWGTNTMAVELTYSVGSDITLGVAICDSGYNAHLFTAYQQETEQWSTFHIGFDMNETGELREEGLFLMRMGNSDVTHMVSSISEVTDEMLSDMLMSHDDLSNVYNEIIRIRPILLELEDVKLILKGK